MRVAIAVDGADEFSDSLVDGFVDGVDEIGEMDVDVEVYEFDGGSGMIGVTIVGVTAADSASSRSCSMTSASQRLARDHTERMRTFRFASSILRSSCSSTSPTNRRSCRNTGNNTYTPARERERERERKMS